MKRIYRMETPKGTYSVADFGCGRAFSIDCACGGRESRIEDADDRKRKIKCACPPLKGDHTYSAEFFELTLEGAKIRGQEPVTVTCTGCGNEFEFTLESYRGMLEKMKANNESLPENRGAL